jgi:hypothetical protein
MKKLLIAIAIVIGLAGIAIVGAGYYLYRQVKSTVASFAEFGQVPELENQLRIKGPYSPPASEELTESQLTRFLAVQTKVKERLGVGFADLERKYKSLTDKKDASLSDVPTLIAAYRDLAATWVDGKRAQVDALNEAGLSIEEYRWIRDQVYRAIGIPYADLDVEKIVNAARSGTSIESSQLRGSIGPSGPEINQKLVSTHRKQLEEHLALASFGL